MTPYAVLLCRGILAAVLTFSMVSKVRHRAAFAEFRQAAGTLSGLTGRAATAVAAVVVTTEPAVVIGLAVTRTVAYAFVVAIVLLCAFTVALLRNRRSAVPVPCRCFGASSTSTGYIAIVRNAALILVAAIGFAASLPPPASGPPPAAAAVCVAAALVVAAGVVVMEQIVDVFTASL